MATYKIALIYLYCFAFSSLWCLPPAVSTHTFVHVLPAKLNIVSAISPLLARNTRPNIKTTGCNCILLLHHIHLN